jgi:acetolactate synthase I/II/III large subunit
VAVDFARHDFAGLAQAFGGAGETVSDSAALTAALERALARKDQFSLIAAIIDRQAYDGRI